MNLTLGFIAFFVTIVIPGILFRRFFYYGEFSKQFNTKDPVLHSTFYSIVPGIVLQLICFFLYSISLGFEKPFFDVFEILRDISSDGAKDAGLNTVNFLNNEIATFFYYTLFVFVFSSVIGWLSSRLIRESKIDKKFKLFRYKNQWYYIFSGEVLNMKKFKDAHRVSYRNNKGKHENSLITYADVLVSVSEQNDRKELYTGFVVDYDLKSEDISKLDKLYLIDTYRYKKKPTKFNKNGDEIKSSNIDNPTKSRNRLKIPGDIFILKADNIVNINLTYVLSFAKVKQQEESRQKTYSWVVNVYSVFLLIIIQIHFFYKILGLDNTPLNQYFENISFWGQLLTVLFLNNILTFILFYKKTKSKWKRVIAIIILGIMVYMFVIRELITYYN